jgi:hypothetical protein
MSNSVDINKLHIVLGHAGEPKIRATAKNFGIKLIGTLKVCECCGLAKAKRMKINKINVNKSEVPGCRVYIDISTIAATSAGNKSNWMLIVDEETNYEWTYFLQKKSDLPATMLQHLWMMQAKNRPIKFIRLDNSGENKKIREVAFEKGFKIYFEFTAPGTPMQNGVVERAFPTLLGSVRAMLNGAKFTKVVRDSIWAECARTATMLENYMSSIQPPYKSPAELLFGSNPN